MNVAGAIVVYAIVWWAVFFAVLPWGVKGRWESEDDGVEGAEPGAPKNSDIKRKMLITSAIAFGLWLVIAAVILSGAINFRD